jgi:hypothetical protein
MLPAVKPMRKVACYLLTAGCITAFNAARASPQEQIDRSRDTLTQALLIPQPKHVSLLVTGDDGVPLSQVRIDHANLKNDLVTGPNGKVGFTTSAPYFVLSRPGYESVRLATKDTADYSAVLHKLSGGEQFRVCTDAELTARVPGWNGIFQVPQSKATKSTTEKVDVDYWFRVVSARSGWKRLWAEQGRGPMWGGGGPEDKDVWKATHYRGVTYTLGDMTVVDAKEWMPDGKCQRSIGMFSESITFYGLNCKSVQPLDDLLDQACMVPDALKRLLP